MSDPLEDRLRRARPTALRPELQARLYAAAPAMPSPKVMAGPHRRGLGWLGAGSLAAAAAVCVGLFHHARTLPGPVPSVAERQILPPVKADRYLVSAEEVGVIVRQPDRAYRLVHCVWMEDQSYRGADGVSTVHVQRAHQQIVPVALTIY